MKKCFGLICSLLVVFVVLFTRADSIWHSSTTREMGDVLVWTNLSYAPVSIASFSCNFVTSTTTEVSFRLVRGVETNIFWANTFTNGNSLFLAREELDGAYLIFNDILRVENSGGTISSNAILSIEAARF